MKYSYYDYQSVKREFDIPEDAFERPDAFKIYEDFKKNIDTNKHPRLMADKNTFEGIKQAIDTDEKLKFMFERISKDAEAALELTDVIEFLDTHRETGLPAGNATCRLYTVRLRDFSFLWQITGDKKYAEAVYQILDRFAELKNWRPGEFLVCSEVMVHVSLAYDWCYEYLKNIDGAVEKIQNAIYEKGVLAGVGAYNETEEDVIDGNPFGRYGWRKADSNWNHIPNSGCVISAITVMEKNPVICSKLIENVLCSVERAFFGYAPDGGYIEGPSYWAYGTNFISYCMMALDHAMGTNYGLFKAPGFSQTCYYRPYVMGASVNPDEPGVRFHWNYHDSGTGLISSAMFMWFARKLKDPNLATLRFEDIRATYDNKVSHSMYAYETANPFDFIYYDKNNFTDKVNLPLDKCFKGLETVFMRNEWDSPGAIYTGLHAGHNNYNHCQLDSGNFIIDGKNIRWITELGMGNYSLPGYFEPKATDRRWTYYTSRAESHNTLIINPGKGPDQIVDSFSPVIKYETSSDSAYAVVDLTDANGKENVCTAQRGLLFTNKRSAIVVQDEVKMTRPSEAYWFALTTSDIDVEISEDGKSAYLSKNGHILLMQIKSDINDVGFEVMPAVKLPTSTPMHEMESRNENYKKIAIHFKNVSEIEIAVVFQFCNSKNQIPEYDYEMKKMEEWRTNA